VVRKAIIFITVILVASVVFAASSNKIVKEAKNLIETGDLIAAENLVDSALVESPDDYKLLRTMGNILLQKEEFSKKPYCINLKIMSHYSVREKRH